jgi:hypothetical protein
MSLGPHDNGTRAARYLIGRITIEYRHGSLTHQLSARFIRRRAERT